MEIKDYIERIRRLQEEKREVQADIRKLFNQAKGEGHSIKAMKRVIRLLDMAKLDREELQFLVDEYLKKVLEEL